MFRVRYDAEMFKSRSSWLSFINFLAWRLRSSVCVLLQTETVLSSWFPDRRIF